MLLKSTNIIQVWKKIKHFMGSKVLNFSFIFETKNKILTKTHNQDNKHGCQESNKPVEIIKGNIDIFSEFCFS